MRYILALLSIVTLWSCSETTTVGSDLVADDKIDIVVSDDFTLGAKYMQLDPVVTYTNATDPRVLYAGRVNDPVFGEIESQFYFQFGYVNSFNPNYDGALLDSMVLMLDILPDDSYGDLPGKSFDIELYQLLTDLTGMDSIRSDASFEVSSEPLAVIKGVKPAQLDSLIVDEPDGTTESYGNVIRFALPSDFSQELFDNREAFGSQNSLTEVFHGFMVKVVSEEDGMIAFHMGNGSSAMNNILKVYYKTVVDTTTSYRENEYQLGFTKPMVYSNDLMGSTVEQYLDQEITGDGYIYTQGFNGPVIELDLSDVLSLNDQNAKLNHAKLDVTVAYDEIGNQRIQPAEDIGLYFMLNGELLPISDLELGIRRSQRETIFGGDRKEPERDFFEYSMTITAFMKQVLDGDLPPKVYLAVLNRTHNPNRTVLYGPEHSQYPVSLRITYTKP